MGRLVFTSGEILTAANMNELSDQSVMVFADSTARSSAIPSPSEGMVTYREDANRVEVYDGASFGPIGGILQVIQVRKIDQFSTTSTSYVDVTGWAASITPSSTSSKILVLVTGSAGSSENKITVASEFQLLRDATAIGNSADNKFYGFAQDANRYSWPVTADFLDSPATTSEVTYQVQVLATGGTTFVNSDGAGRHNNTCSITLMEVAV